MGKGLFITATGTDVGKTYVTGLIVKKLCEAGLRASYYKAALSGAERRGNKLISGDAQFVKEIAGLNMSLEEMVSYVYERAVSPHLAAQIEGNAVELEKVKEDYLKQASQYEYITVEGSGGIICPIRLDETKEIWLEDIIKALQLETIVVADAGLGTINHVVLTISYIQSHGMKVKGIILNHYHKGNIMEEDNLKMIEKVTGVPVITTVTDGAQDLNIAVEELIKLYT